MKRLLIIIPAYNEEETIEKTIAEIYRATFPENVSVEYLVVNDGSRDSTLHRLASGHYSYVDLPCNLGIGGAVQTGFLYASDNAYDYCVQVDGDGQHDPRYIAQMLCVMEKTNADMVIGSRFIDKEGFQSTGARKVGIRIISAMIRLLCGQRIKDVTSGFRLYNQRITSFFAHNYADDYPEPEAIVSAVRNGYRVTETPVKMAERQGGRSSISGIKSIYYMLKVSIALVISSFQLRDVYYGR